VGIIPLCGREAPHRGWPGSEEGDITKLVPRICLSPIPSKHTDSLGEHESSGRLAGRIDISVPGSLRE
jgi:hypothetical protein